MALNFPSNPNIGDIYESDLRQWRWTGTVWQSVNPSTGPTGPTGPTGAASTAVGPTGPTGSMTVGLKSIATSTYTLDISDIDKLVQFTSGCTITIPPNSQTSFPVGTTITLAQLGAAQLVVAAGAGVTTYYSLGNKTRVQYSAASLVKLNTDSWLLLGDLAL